jgi:UPF0755 protein
MFKKITAAALIIIFIAALVYWESLSVKPVMIKIERGTTAREAAIQMKNSGVISSEYAFLILLKISGRSNSLKAGEYALSPRTSIFKILEIVTGGWSVRERVTIPEGFTSRQIAGLLAAKKLADPGKFTRLVGEKKLEGYLFPQTYFFEPGATEEQIINIMLDEFKKIYTPEMQKRAQELRMTEKKVVTLASIIEREAARSEERPLISSVFHNRLKKGWYLESCATVLYALGEHKEKVTLKDLKVKSSYNTYICYGLPPGPICNPGLDSIKAALYPAQTQDMFFVVNGSGTHVFSRYYEEHLKNKRRNRLPKL